MMILDSELDERLARLEAGMPGADPPPIAIRHRTRRLIGGSLGAAIFVLAAAVTTVGAAVIVSGVARGAPGVENPGQPLYGANLECMAPREAATYLGAHGFDNAVWQVERDGRPSVRVSVPPEHGYVVPGSVIDGVLIMIIDQRSDASGVGACFGDPMP